MNQIQRFCLILFTGWMLFLSGCAAKNTLQLSPEDTPEHHYLRGMEALEAENIIGAQAKFERAVFLNEKYSLGYAGLALISANKAKTQMDHELKANETKRATDQLKKAKKLAKTSEEKCGYHITALRVATIIKDTDWLDDAEDFYSDAMSLKIEDSHLLYYQGKEAASYFMGMAFLEAQEFQKARNRFGDVLNVKGEGKWHGPADRAWKKVDEIVRAMAGITVGNVAKRIALQDNVSRADMAALLIDELKIDKIMEGGFPVKSQTDKRMTVFIPSDVMENPFKDEIITLIQLKIRGLNPKYDEASKSYLFMPADDVQRGEMALIFEDVLVKMLGDEKLARAYFNHEKSPFLDVRPTSPIYNAVMNMTTRGIMVADYSGEFRANQPVNGADVILAIRVFKQHMNIY